MTNISNLPIKTAIFHGPSGSGKDTQLDLLEDNVDSLRIGSSAVMVDLKAKNNPLAIEADEYGKKGALYPDELMYGMLGEWLKDANSDDRWFFVSPVRKETQIVLFDELLTSYGRELELFVHFDLPEEIAIERMSLRSSCPKCHENYHDKFKAEKKTGYCDKDGEKLIRREDDNPEAISKRLAWYKDDLQPILEEYDKRGILLEIDASPSIEGIHENLVSELSKI